MFLTRLLRRHPAATTAVAAVVAVGGPLVAVDVPAAIAATAPAAAVAGPAHHHAVAPAVAPAPARAWSDPRTWGGRLPQPGADLVVPAGRTVVLDRDVTVGTLTVDGTLVCGPGDVALTAKNILVNGTLQCGTPQERRRAKFTITLTEPDRSVNLHGMMGARVLGVMGRLELHGVERPAFAKLTRTAPVGATRLFLDRGINWRPGDRVVLASTDFDMNQAEVRTVTAITPTTVSIDRPLAYEHFGQVQSYARPENRSGVDQVDTRGEVALLSRDIVIQGSEDAATSRFGGHVMVMAGGQAHVSGVEFRRMGQLGAMGRYPFHWHLVGDGAGQKLENSSIHDAYNRCVSVHGTDDVAVRRTVCSDTYGHAFITENGEETGVVFDGNIGLLTRRPIVKPLVPSDAQTRGNEPVGPATYWVTNPDNTLVNNVAAGSDGSGFWIAPHDRSLAKDPVKTVNPRRTVLRRMDNNTAHSTNGFAVVFGAAFDLPGSPPTYTPAGTSLVTRMTAWKGSARGLWADGSGVVFDRAALADNTRATFLAYRSEVRNSLVVGESANRGTPRSAAEKAVGRSLPIRNGGILGHTLYDGPSRLDNVYATGFDRDDPGVAFFVPQGAGTKSVVSSVNRLVLDPSTRRIGPDTVKAQDFGLGGFTAIRDEDGSLTGVPGHSVVTPEPLMVDGSCRPAPKLGVLRVCPLQYATLLVTPDAVAGRTLAGRVVLRRSDGVTQENGTPINTAHFQFPVITNGRHHYSVSLLDAPHSRMVLRLTGLPGSTVTVTVHLPGGHRTVKLTIPTGQSQVVTTVG